MTERFYGAVQGGTREGDIWKLFCGVAHSYIYGTASGCRKAFLDVRGDSSYFRAAVRRAHRERSCLSIKFNLGSVLNQVLNMIGRSRFQLIAGILRSAYWTAGNGYCFQGL